MHQIHWSNNYKICKASIPTEDLILKTRRGRNQHSMAFQSLSASTDVYNVIFYIQTVTDWNALPDSLISSADVVEDSDQNQNSLLVKRQNDNHIPGPVIG